MEYTLAVEVLQSSCDVQAEAHLHRPGQEHITVQQLLQVSTINVLHKGKMHTDVKKNINPARYLNSAPLPIKNYSYCSCNFNREGRWVKGRESGIIECY